MKNKIALIIVLITFVACESQVGTAISTAFTNLISGNAFSNSSSDELYQKMKDQALSQGLSENNGTIPSCNNNSLDVINSATGIDFKKVKDNLCSCVAWGTCDKNSCSCDKLCPSDFSILNRSGHAMDENEENSLSFTNGDAEFYKRDSHYTGYCWGHAVVTQRFNRLAKFVPSEPKKFSNPDEYQQRHRELKYILKKLNNNEPVDIPGYRSLKEFSSDPEVKELLLDNVKDEWARNAMSTQGLSIVASGKPESKEYYEDLFNDIEFRLKNHQSPAIVFNQRESSAYAHTVMVSGSGMTRDGTRYLCLRDNNYQQYNNMNCSSKMYLNANGTVSYGNMTAFVYVVNYNVLRVIDGYAGLLFSV
jgi:hypothetical protein